MAIGTSTGEYFDSNISFLTGKIESENSYHNENKEASSPTSGAIPVDNTKHVPLIASAIMGEDGKMQGLAIDHRVQVPGDYVPFLAQHEAAELPHMRNLIDAGMSPQEAYHEAHDKIATPTETAAVRAHAVRQGLDPDAYHEQYKQFFRDASRIASQPSDRDRHPSAHTTVYGLDEAELGIKSEDYDDTRSYIHLAQNLIGNQHPPLSMDVLGEQMEKAGMGVGGAAPTKPLSLKKVSERSIGYSQGVQRYRQTYHLHQGDEHIGDLEIVKNYGGEEGHAHINWAGRESSNAVMEDAYGGSNTLGFSTIRSAFKDYLKQNPDTKTVSAFRVSGARSGDPQDIIFDVVNGKLKLREADSPRRRMRGVAFNRQQVELNPEQEEMIPPRNNPYNLRVLQGAR